MPPLSKKHPQINKTLHINIPEKNNALSRARKHPPKQKTPSTKNNNQKSALGKETRPVEIRGTSAHEDESERTVYNDGIKPITSRDKRPAKNVALDQSTFIFSLTLGGCTLSVSITV
jgi:hypothetical protein